MIPQIKELERTTEEKIEAMSSNHPLLLSPYLDTACNLKCKFCFLDSGKSHKEQQLSLEEYKSLIKQASEMGVKSTLFFGAGEPLMDEKLFPLIEYSNQLGLYSVMFTNATLVTREIAERIKDLDLSVVASIKSRNPETLERLTGVRGSARKIYAGFKHLLDVGLNQTSPTRLGIDILVCQPVYEEVPDLVRFCMDYNIHPMVESLLWKGRAVDNYHSLELTEKQKHELPRRLTEQFPELVGERAYFEGSKCDIDHYTIFTNYNGDIWQCFSRDIVAGNTRKNTLHEIWNSEGLRALRKSPIIDCSICPGRRYNLERNKEHLK